MISRRNFFRQTLQAAAGSSLLLPSLTSCSTEPTYRESMVGPDAALGHRLRTMDVGVVKEKRETDILIVGGGVAGLSAARYISRVTKNFELLELGHQTGGNSIAGVNALSAYPWGAHYLPLPNTNDPELISFLREARVITEFENDLPVYNDFYLCFAPKERLFINNFWQEGIIPHEGVPAHDREEIQRFLEQMEEYKNWKGSDGLEAFAIPLEKSSRDPSLLALDQISMSQYLAREGYGSPYLQWYVSYCCADDYGSSLSDTSAWAGIHYFASRKGRAHNATSDQLLTWPEGNYWLVKQLRKNLEPHIQTQALAYHVVPDKKKVSVFYYDAQRNFSVEVTAKAVIMATPQFINKRLLPDVERGLDYSTFHYAPWMVANMTVDATLQEKRGESLSWDNVVYGSNALGYVYAQHQHLGMPPKGKVITFYQPIVGTDSAAIRKRTYEETLAGWKKMILSNLKKPHPKLENHLRELNVRLWGHGMIRPEPGFVWGANRSNAVRPVSDKLFFANSDVSGISIFEEAFFRGHQAAQQCLQTV